MGTGRWGDPATSRRRARRAAIAPGEDLVAPSPHRPIGAARVPRQPPDVPGGELPVTRLTRVPAGMVVVGDATPLMIASSSSGIVDG